MPRAPHADFVGEKDEAQIQATNLYVLKYNVDNDATWVYYAEHDEAVVFDSDTYVASSIKRAEVQAKKDGIMNRTTLTVPDPLGTVWAAVLTAYDNDTIKTMRVLVRVVFRNKLTQATACIDDEFEVINANRTSLAVEFELSAPVIFEDTLPNDMFMKSRCRHVFKGSRCDYSGIETSCPKTLGACETRDSGDNRANFGGFPTMRRFFR